MYGLLVVFKRGNSDGLSVTSQYLKFDKLATAQEAQEVIRRDFSTAGFSVTSKIIQGVS